MAFLYVNNEDGSDINDGGPSSQFLTPGAAVLAAAPGDSILLQNTGTKYTDTFTNTTISGSAGAPIIIRPENYDDPPELANTTPWNFRGVSWWVIDGFIWDYDEDTNTAGYGTDLSPDGYAIKIGNGTDEATECTDMVVQNSTFRHSTRSGVGGENVRRLTIRRCLFRDIRAREVGRDRGGAEFKYVGRDIIVEECVFEDCGDGIEFEAKVANSYIGDATVRRCVFKINRPYGAVGGATTWQNYDPATYSVDNVGENGVDIKEHNGQIIIEDCDFYGFRTTVSGQDNSGANGECLVIQNDAGINFPVIVRRCTFRNADQGISLTAGTTGTTAAAIIEDCIFTDLDDWAINCIHALDGVTIRGCTIINCAGNYLRLGGANGCLIIDISNNIFANCDSYGYDEDSTGEENIGPNCWYGNTTPPPAAWQHEDDITSDPDLDARFVPASDSPVVGAGVNVGEATDFIGQTRPNPRSMGAYEPIAALPSNIIIYDDFTHRNIALGVTDPNSALTISPIGAGMYADNKHNLQCYLYDTDNCYKEYSYTAGRRVRVGFPIDPNAFPIAGDGDFALGNFMSGTTVIGSVRLRLLAGTWRIVVRVLGDDGAQDYANDGNGSIITDAPHFIDVDVRWADSDGANNGHIFLRVDGILVASNQNLDNDTNTSDGFRFGAAGGIDAAAGNGYYYLLGPIIANNDGAAFEETGDPPTDPEPEDPGPSSLALLRLTHEGGDTTEYTGTVGTVAATARCNYDSTYGLEHSPDGNNYAQLNLSLGALTRFNVATFINLNNLTSPGNGDVLRFLEGYGPSTSLFYLQATIQADTDLTTIGVYYWNGSAYTHLSGGNIDRAGAFDGFIHVEADILPAATGGSIQLFINGLTAGTVIGLTGLDTIAEAMTALRVGSIGNSNGMGGWVCQDYVTISTLQQTIGPGLSSGGPTYGHSLLDHLKVGFISRRGRKPKADWFTGRR